MTGRARGRGHPGPARRDHGRACRAAGRGSGVPAGAGARGQWPVSRRPGEILLLRKPQAAEALLSRGWSSKSGLRCPISPFVVAVPKGRLRGVECFRHTARAQPRARFDVRGDRPEPSHARVCRRVGLPSSKTIQSSRSAVAGERSRSVGRIVRAMAKTVASAQPPDIARASTLSRLARWPRRKGRYSR